MLSRSSFLILAAALLAAPLARADETVSGVCQIDDSQAATLADTLGPILAAAPCGPAKLAGRATPNHSEVVLGDDEALARALEMIRTAKTSIRMETFLLNGDAGNAIATELIAKHREGVDVQLLLDPNALETNTFVGSVLNPDGINTAVYERLAVAGVDVRTYNVLALPSAMFTIRAQHAKLLLVDGREAMMGGTNFDKDVNHDVDVVLQGPAVDDLAMNFDEGWQYAGGDPAPNPYDGSTECAPSAALAGSPAPNSDVRILATAPGRSSKDDVVSAIRNAKTSIWLEMYGLTDSKVIKELLKAKQRGVDVRVVLYDDLSRGVFSPFSGDYDNLGATLSLANHETDAVPVKLFEDLPNGQMHTKMMLVDGQTAYLGSTNYTSQEFGGVHNYVAAIHGGDVVNAFTAMFNDDWANHASDEHVKEAVDFHNQSMNNGSGRP